MKLLITGGAGFIGSHTVVESMLAGHEVDIIDDLSNARASVVDRIAEITGARPGLHVADLRDAESVEEIVAGGGYHAVLHFAGLKAVGDSVADPLAYYSANVGGSVTLLSALARHGVRSLVFSSSCTVYGDPDRVPVTEDMPLKPATNPYGRTKQVIEDMLGDLHRSDGRWTVALLRYFNPVGAHPSGLIGEDPAGTPTNLMPYITRVAAGRLPKLSIFGGDYPTRDGTGIRDYIHVVDLALGHLAALDHLAGRTGVHTWNLGTGAGTSVLEMVSEFERVTGAPVPYEIVARRPGDVAETWADPSRAHRDLGWSADRSLADVCADAWRWEQRATGR